MAARLIDHQNSDLKRISDFISTSIIFYFLHLKVVFKKILFWQFISILVLIFLFISFGGEFNLTFFLSNEGKILIALIVLAVVLNAYNSANGAIQLVCFQNLEFRRPTFSFKVLFMILVRFILLFTLLLSVYFEEKFSIMLVTFIILNTFFYFFLFKVSMQEFTELFVRRSLAKTIKINLIATLLIFMNRFFVTIVPLIATFSIFIVYEFMRILITGKVFFYASDRVDELLIFIMLFLMLFFIFNPIQYFTMMIFYKSFHDKELTNPIKK